MFNPSKRLSIEQALRHPYVAQFHNSAEEPSCPKIIVLPISDNTKYTVQEYRCVCVYVRGGMRHVAESTSCPFQTAQNMQCRSTGAWIAVWWDAVQE